jgi:hypothetical protein
MPKLKTLRLPRCEVIKKLLTDNITQETLKCRFQRRTRLDESTGCRIWLASGDKDGYCNTSVYCVSILVHRLAYILKHQKNIPAGLVVRHSAICGTNRSCVNPDHLNIGTQQDNMDDMVKAGTQAKGEAHGNSKLTQSDVAAIIASRGTGTLKERAAKLGIKYGTLRGVDEGATWKHSAGPARELKRHNISEETAKAIIASHGIGSKRERATRFGVTYNQVRFCDNGSTWKHLHRPWLTFKST